MILIGFIAGLTSSLHCVGMCGPIAFMLPLARDDRKRKALQLAAYHFGRLLTYMTLGLIFGFVGRGLYLSGIQQTLSISLGLILILNTLISEKKWTRILKSKNMRLVSFVKSRLANRLRDQRISSILAFGMLNGLLPCGMVYGALFGAMAVQDIAMGTAYMGAFGLGTIPLMASVNLWVSFAPKLVKHKLRLLVPAVSLSIGLLLVLRGLGLDWNDISPSAHDLAVRTMSVCR